MKTNTTLKHLLIIAVLIISQKFVSAQYYNFNTGDTNIYQIYSDFYSRIDSATLAADTLEDSPVADFMKWYNFWEPRLAPTGSFTLASKAWSAYAQSIHTGGGIMGAHSAISYFCSSGTPIPSTWTELGVNVNSQYNSGRVNCIAFDPTTSSTMYVGGADGGVYQSTNSGGTWVNMGTDNQLLSLGVSDIKVEPSTSDVVYMVSGDEQSSVDFTDGVYRTNDANDGNNAVWTWQAGPVSLSGYTTRQYIYQLAIDAVNSDYLYTALDDPNYMSSGGIWYANNRSHYSSSLLYWQQDDENFSCSVAPTDACFSVVSSNKSMTVGRLLGSYTAAQLYVAGYDIFQGNINAWTSMTGPNTGTHGAGTGLDLRPVVGTSSAPFQLLSSNFQDPDNSSKQLTLNRIVLTLSNDGNYLYAYIWTSGSVSTYSFVARYNFTLVQPGWDIIPSTTTSYSYNSTSPPDCVGSFLGRHSLAIDPNTTNGLHIFVGTTSLNESTDGGHSWNIDYGYTSYHAIYPCNAPSNGPHVDYHAISYQPGSSDTVVFLGTDGGLSSIHATTNDAPSHLTELDNGLGYSLDYDAKSSEQNVGDVWQTLQDDGANQLLNNSYTNDIDGIGDGQYCLVDYLNNTNVYLSSSNTTGYGGACYYSGVYPLFWQQINYDGDLRGDPILLNPFNPNTMYEGRQQIQKCDDVESGLDCLGTEPTHCWEQISAFGVLGGQLENTHVYDAVALAVSPTDTNYMYAALSASPSPPDYSRFVWSSVGGGTGSSAWGDGSPDHLNYTIPTNGIAPSYKNAGIPSPTNPYHVWVCYSGYDMTHKVKEGTYDGSNWSWADDNTGLCNFNINCIVYENGSNDGLYLGTDAGVYYTNAAMTSWERLGTTFPNVVVTNLSINYCAKKLIVSTYGRGTWETDLVPSTSSPLQITTNTIWSHPQSGTSMMIPADVEITSPNTLTISSNLTVNMSEGHSIIVDPGAKLIVNGTITNGCGDLWAGIQLNGNTTLAQTSANQGTLILNSGSIIERAVTGVSTSSGIITANGATFYNNQRDVVFSPYTAPAPHAGSNKCSFINCTFQTDANYIYLTSHTYSLLPMVTMTDVYGVTFQGNTFVDSIPYTGANSISDKLLRGSGISSVDATYGVTNCSCLSTYPPGGCCGAPNTFTGLYFGIVSENSNPSYTGQIIGNTFDNNYCDIDIVNINNMVITNNTFTKTAFVGNNGICFSNCPPPYNIYLDQCSGYNVSGNSMTNSSYYTSSSNPSYGTVVNNSGPANNLINNNTFNGIYVQSQAQGTNGQVYFVIIPHTIPTAYYSGLQYQCNQYTSSVSSGADIAVASGLIDGQQGSCSTIRTAANNEFNYTCSSYSRNNIYTYPGYDLTYSCASSTPTPPSCVTSGVLINNCTFSTGSCAATTYTITIESGSILADNSVNYHSTLRTQKQAFNYKKDSLEGILAKGNKSGLYAMIASGDLPTVILDSLLAPGPYLSDSVMKTAMLSGLPLETIANMLIPNSPLDSAIVANLDALPIPDTMAARLDEYQTDALSPRSILITGINFYQGMMDFTDNALITALETDSTVSHPFDSAQAVLKSDTLTLPRLAQLATLQWAAGENSTALVTLDTLHKHDKDSVYARYCQLLPVLMTLSSSTNGYLSLHGNSADSTLLEHIAMDTLTPGYANARAVLEFVYNQAFDEPIIPLSDGTHRPIKKKNNLDIVGYSTSQNASPNSLFNLYPNPANSSLTIAYSLNKTAQEVNISIYDVLGNKAANWSLPCGASSNNVVNENISSLSPGMYFYTIFEDNKAVQRGKLVIER